MSDLLTYREAASYCHVSKSTFFEHVRPHVRHVKIGGSVRYRIGDLERYLAAATH